VRSHARNFSRRLPLLLPASGVASRETAVCTRASLAETKRAGESRAGEIYRGAKNILTIFARSQICLPHASNRLRFTPKEQKFVTVRVTNFVVLTPDGSGVKISLVP
jgi:hypothetical protein